jgi:Ethanolamine utilization protein EutJ (predicted chaperonin)
LRDSSLLGVDEDGFLFIGGGHTGVIMLKVG